MDLKYATYKREVFFEIAKKHMADDSVVLDIGAGNASFAKYCKRNDIFLFDGNEETIKELQTDYQNCFLGALPELPFVDGFFDLIHCSHVVEHLEPQLFYDTLKEMDRCLKPQGFLVISAPMMWDSFYDDLSHVKPYNPNIYIRYLTDTGNQNYTREKISNDYELISLQYRYYQVPYLEKYQVIHSGKKARLLKRIMKFCHDAGLRKYEKNGYTIVLRKN